MQLLYAWSGNETDNPASDRKQLLQSIEGMLDLYLLLLSLLVEVQGKAKELIEKSQKKHLATTEDINPNEKFVNNRVLELLRNDDWLVGALKERGINHWELDGEYIDVIFNDLVKSELYRDYMAATTSSFEEDKQFVISVFRDLVAPNDKLYDYLEDHNITWSDDLPVINTNIVKKLRKLRPNSPSRHFAVKLIKDPDDKAYALDLLDKTKRNRADYTAEIEAKTTNWDKERIANLDFILMQMAICEFREFPTVPVRVTINEYIEIAKEYSTPKSSVFINGILDKILKDYNNKGTLNKTGRGLL